MVTFVELLILLSNVIQMCWCIPHSTHTQQSDMCSLFRCCSAALARLGVFVSSVLVSFSQFLFWSLFWLWNFVTRSLVSFDFEALSFDLALLTLSLVLRNWVLPSQLALDVAGVDKNVNVMLMMILMVGDCIGKKAIWVQRASALGWSIVCSSDFV